jgi:N-sulfoglucosamine sulfohydrolase
VQRVRSVHDARYHYIRNSRTGPTFASLNRYKEKCFPIYPLMRELHTAGRLTGAPFELMERTRPCEELYDTASDPHEIATSSRRPSPNTAKPWPACAPPWIPGSVETGDRGAAFPEPPEIVAPFAKEMHDWFGTPAWAQSAQSPAPASSATPMRR